MRITALLCTAAGLAHSTTVTAPRIADPTAVAAKADVCFARVRGLDPGRLPPAYLVLHRHVSVAYRNSANRPMILPLQRERVVYTALKPGKMSVFKEGWGLLAPVLNPMGALPPDVSPDNPLDPKNDVFTVIPAGGEMAPPLDEEIIIPVSRKGFFKKYPDLRGKRVYVNLQFVHRELAPGLDATLSDRWSRFGVPWTGTLTTNTILIDVPESPDAAPCTDIDIPAYPASGQDHMK